MKKIIYYALGGLAVIVLSVTVIVLINSKPVDIVKLPANQTIFGEPVIGDLNADGLPDKALWLVENPGGSGTFFYAQLLINNGSGYTPTNTMFLGDRIAPQNINIMDGRAVYNFAERRANEPMTTPPSIGKSVWINYDQKTNQIGEWVKDFEGESANNNIHVSNPIANTVIASPLIIKGEAKGPWFFEASFPVVLKDSKGVIIAQGIAQAQSDWMTTGFVPFTATLNFTKPSSGTTGTLIFKKDNPSGLPQNDDALEIQVKF
ncbi:MAG: Gmad2 immunoglobulin-like domain-containing protein [bacterium]